MQLCFVTELNQTAVPITVVTPQHYSTWLAKQTNSVHNWLASIQFLVEPGNFCLIPQDELGIQRVLCCLANEEDFWGIGNLPLNLPEGIYTFEEDYPNLPAYALAWGLGAYQFTRYKKPKRLPSKLVLPKKWTGGSIENKVESIYLVRDCINTPTEDMGPSELAQIMEAVSYTHLTLPTNREV